MKSYNSNRTKILKELEKEVEKTVKLSKGILFKINFFRLDSIGSHIEALKNIC